MSRTVRLLCRPSFDLGQVVATPGALATTANGQRLRHLARHSIGDWGRILRPIGLTPITEGDRSVTTLLLPGE